MTDLRSEALPGLTSEEAARRLAVEGPNLLPGSAPKSSLRIAGGVLAQPMFLLLLAAGALYLLLGDRAEALFLLAFVFVVIGITIAQEHRTQRALDALRDLSAPRASVVRDGVQRRIAGRDVIRGDRIVVRAGDRVPADADLLEGRVAVDESLLTGESLPVDKAAAAPGARRTAGRGVDICQLGRRERNRCGSGPGDRKRDGGREGRIRDGRDAGTRIGLAGGFQRASESPGIRGDGAGRLARYRALALRWPTTTGKPAAKFRIPAVGRHRRHDPGLPGSRFVRAPACLQRRARGGARPVSPVPAARTRLEPSDRRHGAAGPARPGGCERPLDRAGRFRTRSSAGLAREPA